VSGKKEHRMPPGRQLGREASVGPFPMPIDSTSHFEAAAPPSDAESCERAIHAIWHSLDTHDLVDGQVRRELAKVLEPLTAMTFADRPQRLIEILRLPDPIDPAHLYWLTRRLLTLVPELQAAVRASANEGDPLVLKSLPTTPTAS
jgi:hypothetical protein